MAKASSTEVNVTKIVTAKEKVITLELSQDEAQAVADVFGSVAGSPKLSRRKYTDAVVDALRGEGFSWDKSPFLLNNETDISDLEATIHFSDSK